MILQSLNELYDRLAEDKDYGISPPGFSPQKISFRIVINEDGTLFAIEDARQKNSKGQLENCTQEVPAHEKRTSGVKSQFLCDKLEYMLGYQAKNKPEGAGKKCFEEYRRKHLEISAQLADSAFDSFCRFLSLWDPSKLDTLNIAPDLTSGFGVIQMKGVKRPIHERDNVKEWWLRHYSNRGEGTPEEQCLVTGERGLVCRIHPDIKGFKSSIALVGIQENTAYESYNWSKTENCPIRDDVTFRYATALNSLLAGPQKKRHRLGIAGTSVVVWSEKPSVLENVFAEFFENGFVNTDEVQDASLIERTGIVLDALKKGVGSRYFDSVEANTPFYILGLEQPNPGRFAIRFFVKSSTGKLVENFHDHFSTIEIEKEFENDPDFPPVWRMLDELVPKKKGKPDREKIPPLLGGEVARAIIEGTRYPQGLFLALLRRIRVLDLDKKGKPKPRINFLRASILKAILQRNYNVPMSTTLDKEHPSRGYHLGRLFAVFEQSQRQAHEFKLERTIRETFFSSASATPLSVFARLHRLHMHHLRKLSNGSQKYFEDWVCEIEQKFGSSNGDPASYPATLGLKEQGLFSIGYYHQINELKHNKPEKD